MTVGQIENNLNTLVEKISSDTFVFDLLLAFDFPNATIKRLQNSEHNQLLFLGELALRKHLFFRVSTADELYSTLEALSADPRIAKHSPRFIIVTDYVKILALDTKTKDTLDIQIEDIVKHYDFFLPWAGMEKATYQDENPADVKASLKMAKLYDELQKNNSFKTKEEIHSLNVFLTRLLFCYFAEDTNIFADNLFTASIESHTQTDGSDLDSYLARLFEIFNTPEKDRDKGIPAYLSAFPYVNGGLFREVHTVPKFTAKSRAVMIEVGGLNWSEINPDIFGSMIQAVVTPEHRGTMGMHYTSVPNIMKVIEPLFLDELYEEFKNSYDNKSKLQHLLTRLANIKIFDPACGSGNFLIISYRCMRTLEMEILKRINALENMKQGEFFGTKKQQGSFLSLSSQIKLTQFYGIELDDFAHEVALLSLWLVEHQMNKKFYDEFGQTTPPLPLKNSGNIAQGNATRLNWEEVCPKNNGDEIYILGNPPYLGARLQSKEQKEDIAYVLKDIKNFNNLDYIACWFYKGANYIANAKAKVAFVSTNSISQGEQVGILWPYILSETIEIGFAHKSFKWQNNAKANAAVIVVIIGLRNISNMPKYLFSQNIKHEVKNINAYLVNADNIIVQKRSKPFLDLPEMQFGNMANDGGHFILTDEEKDKLLDNEPLASKYIKKLVGSEEFLNGKDRWCLWLKNLDFSDLAQMPQVKERIEKVKANRLQSPREATKKLANNPHLFGEIRQSDSDYLIIPRVSSENRYYVPFGYISRDTIVTDRCAFIPNADLPLFGIMTSAMHMAWMKATCGRLKTDYNYSIQLVYNTFPFPNISQKQKDEITELVFGILDEREKHTQKTLAQLYDPDKMPEGLRKAHHNLDIAIERCYRTKPFESDEERLEYLFKMYEEMTRKGRKDA